MQARKRASHGFHCQFGVRFPMNIAQAYKLDKANGDKLCSDAIDKEVHLLQEMFGFFSVAE